MDLVYIETSIVSFATANPGRDLESASLQWQARSWWESQKPKFEVVTSQLTISEAAAGDPDAASRRIQLLDGIPLVPIDESVEGLAAELLDARLMPPKAAADALHVAAAAVARVDYLLTLNCKHIANARELPRVYAALERAGFGELLICTPAQFLDDGESTGA